MGSFWLTLQSHNLSLKEVRAGTLRNLGGMLLVGSLALWFTHWLMQFGGIAKKGAMDF